MSDSGDFQLFPGAAEREARGRAFHAMVTSQIHRDEHATGGADRLAGVSDPIVQLNLAQDAFERAQSSGDAEQKAYAEHLLDRAVEAAREARQEREQEDRPRNPDGTFASSFDGGARRAPGQRRPMPGAEPETANQLLVRAMSTSRSERRAREEAGETVVGNI